MHFSLEELNALAPDEETLKRAEKISDPRKWSTATFNNNILWGTINGSGFNDYNVVISLEPLIFSCDCPVRVQPCKHSLALLILYTGSKLNYAEMPTKVLLWAEKNVQKNKSIEIGQALLPSDSATKEKKKNERLVLMRSGLEDLERWLYDLMAQGLANIAHSNDRYWENSAARFKDSKLGRVAYTLREIADEFSYKSTDYEKITIKIGELSLLVKAAKNIEKLDSISEEELLNQLGRLLRKNEVLGFSNIVHDWWTVIGQTEEYNLDGLTERRVWLFGKKSRQIALLLDYLFQGDFDLKFKVGESFESELYFYPSTVFQRALLNTTEICFSVQDIQFEGFNNFESFLGNYSRKLKANPWLAVETGIIDHLRIVIISDKPYIVDQNLTCFPIVNISPKSLLKLLAISASEPMSFSVLYNNIAFEILAYIKDGSIYAF
jgi:hypothetical protein